MSDNPYRFTLEVRAYTFPAFPVWQLWLLLEGTLGEATLAMAIGDGFRTEAEANDHAELIRQAMREVSSPPVPAEETRPNTQVQP